MKNVITAIALSTTLLAATTPVYAGMVSSADVITQQQMNYDKNQILSYVDQTEVLEKLQALGVSAEDAKSRIANLTAEELAEFNKQMNEAPAGGIVGTVVTVLVVIAVLDLLGVTNVFSFIQPIN
ncbi:MAG: PA2779 family protein [Gammaproteobacteria bacterium]|nr:PA2779 family protein [Gammaproteobacteria bacterium]